METLKTDESIETQLDLYSKLYYEENNKKILLDSRDHFTARFMRTVEKIFPRRVFTYFFGTKPSPEIFRAPCRIIEDRRNSF